MTKSEQLTQLFAKWKQAFDLQDTNFYADGIINENLFDSCKAGHKILVIAKEPNATNHEQTADRSFITEWDGQKAEYPFALRIAEWVYGIIHDFPVYDEARKQARAYLRHISFMNVKKMGGGGLADRKKIYNIVQLQVWRIEAY